MSPAAAAGASRHVAIVDLLDRLLTSGAVVHGDVVLSAADIDLVRLDLRLLLASVDTLSPSPSPADTDPADTDPAGAERDGVRSAVVDAAIATGPRGRRSPATSTPSREAPLTSPARPSRHVPQTGARRPPPARTHGGRAGGDLARRISADPEGAEKGLAQLVLTVVELLRQLMERQALHRVDAGSLSEEEVERLGRTFQALAERMEELKTVFGLDDSDLNLNLGPLGDLL